mmetsp:Transcript_15907/g.47848  ORF Transcript_15907/g.47848 Transcript_15907/m.47848 type:complete len:277 (+) Transcript_15907:410-1240(+)
MPRHHEGGRPPDALAREEALQAGHELLRRPRVGELLPGRGRGTRDVGEERVEARHEGVQIMELHRVVRVLGAGKPLRAAGAPEGLRELDEQLREVAHGERRQPRDLHVGKCGHKEGRGARLHDAQRKCGNDVACPEPAAVGGEDAHRAAGRGVDAVNNGAEEKAGIVETEVGRVEHLVRDRCVAQLPLVVHEFVVVAHPGVGGVREREMKRQVPRGNGVVGRAQLPLQCCMHAVGGRPTAPAHSSRNRLVLRGALRSRIQANLHAIGPPCDRSCVR